MKPEQMIQAVRGKAVEIFFHTGYERFVPLDDVEKIILTATEPEDDNQIALQKIKEIIDAIEATGSTKPITLLEVVERLNQEDK